MMAIAELSGHFAAVAPNVPLGCTWEYKTTLISGRVNHCWSIVHKQLGGVQIHGFRVSYASDTGLSDDWCGGIEVHKYTGEGKPSQEHCWLLDAPCWHDGTSFGFSEQVQYGLPDSDDMKELHHVHVTRVLARWFHLHLENCND